MSWLSCFIIFTVCIFLGIGFCDSLIDGIRYDAGNTYERICGILGLLFFLPPVFLLPKLLRGILRCVIISCCSIAKLFCRIIKIFSGIKNLTVPQKYFFCFSLISLLLLILSLIARFDYGFYVFLRIVVFCALAGLCLEKNPMWLKFSLLLLAILYNPIIQIHLQDRYVWAFFNVVTIPALLVPWIVLICRKSKQQTDFQKDLQNGSAEKR